MIMIDDIGTPAAEAALDLPDFSQFYTSRVNHKTEDGQTYAEKVEEAISTARDAWPAGSKYEIIDAIALGGMGCILQAYDRDADREVAMKVMLRGHGDEELVGRFLREAQIVANLEHPNIVPVHDIGRSSQDEPYFTMKWVRGSNLYELVMGLKDGKAELLARKPLRALLEDFVKLCNAVAFAHSRKIIHLDLKPNNVMIGDFGEVILLDWGLAKNKNPMAPDTFNSNPTNETIAHPPTRDGIIRGTPGFMAPEQATGDTAIQDERTDIYSLGAILYMILTHKCPIVGESPKEMIRQTRRGTIVPPGQRTNQNIPAELEALVMKSMAQDMDQRYNRAEDLKTDIEAYLSGYATSVEGAGLLKRSMLLIKRNRREASLIAGSIAIICGLIVALGFMLDQGRQADRSSERNTKSLKQYAGKIKDAVEQQKVLVEQLKADVAMRDAALAQQGYARSIHEAAAALTNRRYQPARAALDSCAAEFRHWEWGRLQHMANPEQLRIDVGESIKAMAMDASGRRLATTSAGRGVVFWDTDTGQPETELGRITLGTVCLTMDGAGQLVTGSEDGLIRVWEDRSYQTLGGHTGGVSCIATTPRGRVIAAGSDDGSVRIWTGDKLESARTFADAHDYVAAIAVFPNDRWLATAGTDGIVKIWDLRSRRVLHTLDAHRGGVNAIAFTRKPPQLITAGKDRRLVYWDIRTGRAMRTQRDLVADVTGIWTNDETVATCDSLGTTRLWDQNERVQRLDLGGHMGSTNSVVGTGNGNLIVTAGADGMLKLWDVTEGWALQRLKEHRDAVQCIAYSADGTLLASGGDDRTAHVWDRTGKTVYSLPHKGSVTGVAFIGNDRLLTTGDDGKARAWDLEAGRATVVFAGHLDAITSCAVSSDGRRVITGSDDGTARVWNATGRPLAVYQGHNGGVPAVAFTVGGDSLTGSADGTTRLWSAETGKVIRRFEGGSPVSSLALQQGALVTGHVDGSCQLWDVQSGARIRVFRHESSISGVVISNDGARLFAASGDRSLRVWNMSGATLLTQRCPDAVHALALNPDNTVLATGGDRDVVLWESARWVQSGD